MRGPTRLVLPVALALVAGVLATCSIPSADTNVAADRASVENETQVPSASVAPAQLRERIDEATSLATERQAVVSIAFLNRETGDYLDNGQGEALAPTASVAKLLIADDVLFRSDLEDVALTDEVRDDVSMMLRASDDFAANELWDQYGSNEIVTRVASRYHLDATNPPYDDFWWNTETTASDLVEYYNGLISGSGGLSGASTEFMLDELRNSAPEASDGYDQRFGIPAGLPDVSMRAVKQGWMCCWDDQWIHNSTGVFGSNSQFVLVVLSRENSETGDDHAKDTLTQVVQTMFPVDPEA